MRWLSAFTAAAGRYWLTVFPLVSREIAGWERRACVIADRTLRRVALHALSCERGNLEGAAAFAAFHPRAARAAVARASVAFQAAYDYVDALCEQPNAAPVENAHCLHSVLPAALGWHTAADDYYRHHQHQCDSGYIDSLRDACRTVVHALPAFAIVAETAQAAARRIQAYQALNLSESQGGRLSLARWATRNMPPAVDLRWWETAASAGSSLLVFALIAAAARPETSAEQTAMLASAYFPWIGALHTLLDSLIDQEEDGHTGHRSLLDYYRSPEEAAQRMANIAAQAVRHARALDESSAHHIGESDRHLGDSAYRAGQSVHRAGRSAHRAGRSAHRAGRSAHRAGESAHRIDSGSHRMILAAMASFYLSAAPADSPYVRLVRPSVLAAMGELARPTMLIMRARRKAAQLRPHRPGTRSRA